MASYQDGVIVSRFEEALSDGAGPWNLVVHEVVPEPALDGRRRIAGPWVFPFQVPDEP